MDWLLAGFVFGFVGSVHCVGMCGPLALALPGAAAARVRFIVGRMLYNLGRATTYAGLGAGLGALGAVVTLAGWQRWLAFGLGVVLVLLAFVPVLRRRLGRVEGVTARWLGPLLARVGPLYQRGGLAALFAVGLVNGLLPCGFVYAALATAIASGTVQGGAGFMAAFGLGTLPAMLALSLAGRRMSTRWRTRLAQWAPLGLAVVGVLLILRGLSLGLFLSPDVRMALFTPEVCRFLPFVDPVR
ncbi:MAG: sulfite exporter TauE/SafE family protein [Bacteroidota bacterium]